MGITKVTTYNMHKAIHYIRENFIELTIVKMFAIFLVLFLAYGCGTMHKAKTSSSYKLDSLQESYKSDIRATRTDSSGTSTRRDTATSLKASSYERQTVILYDTVFVEGEQRIKYITISEKGQGQEESRTGSATGTTGAVRRVDSVNTVDTKAVQVHREAESKAKRVEKKGPTVLQWAGLISFCLSIVAGALWLIVYRFRKS